MQSPYKRSINEQQPLRRASAANPLAHFADLAAYKQFWILVTAWGAATAIGAGVILVLQVDTGYATLLLLIDAGALMEVLLVPGLRAAQDCLLSRVPQHAVEKTPVDEPEAPAASDAVT